MFLYFFSPVLVLLEGDSAASKSSQAIQLQEMDFGYGNVHPCVLYPAGNLELKLLTGTEKTALVNLNF